MISSRLLRCLLFISASSLFVTGCDGNGDTFGVVSDGVAQTSSGSDPYPARALNNTLTGRVFETADPSYTDLDTGEKVVLAADFAYPSRDGQLLIELSEDVRFVREPSGCMLFNDRITVRNAASGQVSNTFELPADVYGPIKLSPDGQTMALVWNKGRRCYDEDTSLTVLSRTGEEIIRGVDSINSYDWLPDNRLVFSWGQLISVESERNTLRSKRIADMSDVPGVPGRIAVSPDGSQVLFEMITRGSSFLSTVNFRDATVWSVNIDGTNLRQLATSSRPDDPGTDFDDPQVNMPVWSPDGQTILITEGYTSGGVVGIDINFLAQVVPVSNEGLTYALPADSTNIALPPQSYSADGIRPMIGANPDATGQLLSLNPFASILWSPPIARAPVLPGSLPGANGLINRGLTGTLYYMGDDEDYEPAILAVDLATANVSIVASYAGLDYDDYELSAISADGSFTAHSPRYSNSLTIHDRTGELVQNLSLITDRYHLEPESAFHFSPVNNNHLAWIYDDDNFGTGVVVLDRDTLSLSSWFNRDYDYVAWTREGNLLVFDEGQAYLSEFSDDGFGDFTMLFDVGEPVYEPAVNPADNTVAFSAAGQIFTIGLDGQNIRRIVSFSDGSTGSPVFSPDGRFLSVSHLGYTYIVAADAQDVRLYEDHRSMGGFELGEGINNGMVWRDSRLAWQ